jgi:hypothetical protein
MNSIVENLHQRQDIMTWIAEKNPDGLLIQKRYVKAHQDLINSLVRAGFLLDNSEESELMSLADSCAIRLDSNIKKEAFWPLAGGVAATLGALWYFINGSDTAQNVFANAGRVLEALKGLETQPYYNTIYEEVSTLRTTAQAAFSKRSQVISDATNKKATSPENIKFLNDYAMQLDKVLRDINDWQVQITNQQQNDTTEHSDWYSKLMGITKYLYRFTDNQEKLVAALGAPMEDYKGIMYGQSKGAGLYEAIINEKRIISQFIRSQQTPQKLDTEPKPLIQTDKPQSPTPVKAPEQNVTKPNNTDGGLDTSLWDAPWAAFSR